MRYLQRFETRWLSQSRATQGAAAGLVCALVVGIGQSLGLMASAERGLLDALFHARKPFRNPAPQVVVVQVDDATIAGAGRWPLPRSVYAAAIDRLTAAGARTIALDILFTAPGNDAADEAALARACRQSGRVIPAISFMVPLRFSAVLPVSMTADKARLDKRLALSNRGIDALDAAWHSSASPAVGGSAPVIGHVNVFPEVDGALRRIPHVIRSQGELFPSLALAAAIHYEGVTPRDVIAREGVIELGRHRIPVNSDGETLVNWVGAGNSFPTYSLNRLLKGDTPEGVFKDRIVLIGTDAAGTFDHHPTPFSPLQPGVDLQASALDNILHDRALHELPEHFSWALLAGFAMLVGALAGPRPGAAGSLASIGLASALWLIAVVAFFNLLYVPVAGAMLAGLLTYVATSTTNYRREWEANWRVDASVATLARGGALMTSGRDRDRLTELVRRTARETLQARDVYLVEADPAEPGPVYDVARFVVATNAILLWPAAGAPPLGRATTQRYAAPAAATVAALRELCTIARVREDAAPQPRMVPRLALPPANSVVAVRLPHPGGAAEQAEKVNAHQVLIAVGRLRGGPFTRRDATLLETIAEQAALALDNQSFYEKLQGEVESADRDLREAYRLLAEQSSKLTAAVESIDDALIVTGEAGRAVFVNAAAQRILRDAVPSLGQVVPEVLRTHGLAELAAMFQGLAEGTSDEEPTFLEVTRHGDDRGATAILQARFTPLLGVAGQPLGAMLVVADVTAQRALDQMKTDFVSFVAHELRSPLTTILGYASLLRDSGEEFPAAQRVEMAGSIMTYCQRLNRMISEMLDIARLDAGHALAINRTPFDLAALTERLLAGFRTTIRQHHEIVLDCPEKPLLAVLDSDRIEQIIINLVTNAVKYSPNGGTITVRLWREKDHIVLAVTDSGIGIEHAQIKQLFQKFYRTQEALAHNIRGTGLGLFLVRQLVEAHDGTIVVTSQPGQGSTFTVTLPGH